MSKKPTLEEQIAEAEAADAAVAAKYKEQQACVHWRATPTEWWWGTGKVREMTCLECDATRCFNENGDPE